MLTLALRTIGRLALTFFVIVTLVFFVTRLTGILIDSVPGEGLMPEDRAILIRFCALDRPVWDQHVAFLPGFTDGECGLSFIERRPVAEIVAERIAPSLHLLAASVPVTFLVVIPQCIAAAVWRDRWIGSAVMAVAFFRYAIQDFVLAVFLVLTFAYWLNWLPVMGNGRALHFLMPTAVLSAALMRFTRNAMLDVLGQDYMRTALAKGLPDHRVILRHGPGNAWITILSAVGLKLAGLAPWLGTDEPGRDILSRGLQALLLTLMLAALGATLGLLAGVTGGRVEAAIMGAFDARIAVLLTPIALFVLTVFGSLLTVLVFVLGLYGWEQYASIALTHLLPNVVSPLVVQFTLSLSKILLQESTLSFLDLGVQPPIATLGAMVGVGRDFMPSAPWIVLVPAALILSVAFSTQILGACLHDRADVRLRQR